MAAGRLAPSGLNLSARICSPVSNTAISSEFQRYPSIARVSGAVGCRFARRQEKRLGPPPAKSYYHFRIRCGANDSVPGRYTRTMHPPLRSTWALNYDRSDSVTIMGVWSEGAS